MARRLRQCPGKNGGLPGGGRIAGIGRHGRFGRQFKRQNGLELVIDWKLGVCWGESGRKEFRMISGFWLGAAAWVTVSLSLGWRRRGRSGP